MIRGVVCTAMVSFCVAAADAVTWEFDVGSSQGWTAQANTSAGRASTAWSALSTQSRDGTWRISLPAVAADGTAVVRLTAPYLGADSGLFDRVSVRLRAVGADRLTCRPSARWTNDGYVAPPVALMPWESSAEQPAVPPVYVASGSECVIQDQWQDVTVAQLRAGTVEVSGRQVWLAWEGELHRVCLDLSLSGPSGVGTVSWPEALDVAWIRLTGAEEQLQGEVPPPSFARTTGYGALFEDATYGALGPARLVNWYQEMETPATLGDLDGNGCADLVACYDGGAGSGWLTATGLVAGGKIDVRTHAVSPAPLVWGADLTGDGRLEAVLWTPGSRTASVLRQDSAGTWQILQEPECRWPLGVGDADGDGAPDLWRLLPAASGQAAAAEVLLNDGSGWLGTPLVLDLADSPLAMVPALSVRRTPAGAARGVLWMEAAAGQPGYSITYLDGSHHVLQEALAAQLGMVDYLRIRHAGDWDGDGDTDLVLCQEATADMEGRTRFGGLVLLQNGGDGSFREEVLSDDVELRANVDWCDLNGDGLLDLAFCDTRAEDPAVLVYLRGQDGTLLPEGRYLLSTGRGGAVLYGDADGDGDVDVAVLEAMLDGAGGLHLLLNQLRDGSTAVGEDHAGTDGGGGHGAATPHVVLLAAAYPNPFNPDVTIPFTLEADAAHARLTVHDVLGQPVRTLVDGWLGAGEHRVVWDGRDARGADLPSGVYFIRLEAGAETVTSRCLRLE